MLFRSEKLIAKYPSSSAAQIARQAQVPGSDAKFAVVFAAIGMSIVGAVLLSLGNVDFTRGNTTLGMVSAAVSVVSYGGYIVGVRKSRAVGIDSTVLTCYVMGLGALYFIAGGLVTGGIRIETDGTAWLCILGVALPATAVSNMTLVQAIKRIGPTLTSVFGALEPLTAVVIGVAVFGEPFTAQGAAGILLIVAAVLTLWSMVYYLRMAWPEIVRQGGG